MKLWQLLKQRLVALVLLTAFAVAMLMPSGSAEAASLTGWLGSPSSGVTQRVSWNSGPQ